MQHGEIEGEQRDDDAGEGEPDPGRLAQEVGGEEGNRGLGVADVGQMRGLRRLGRRDDVTQQIHAIRSRRGQHHPLVLKAIAAARLRPGPAAVR